MNSKVRLLRARVVQQEARSSPRAGRSPGASTWGAREPPGCGDSAGTGAGDRGRAAGPAAELCALATGAFTIDVSDIFSDIRIQNDCAHVGLSVYAALE